MIIYSNGVPNHNTMLPYMPRPPGGGAGSYDQQCVTRSYVAQPFIWKIPLNPVALSTADSSVNNVAYLNSVGNILPGIPLSATGAIGVSITGMPLFPPYNNVGGLTWLSCEQDWCNAHSGQKFDYHYHGDPFGPNCMYSSSDYSSTTAHPPIIGYSLDGFPMYGRYLDNTASGYSIALDACGGHMHSPDTYGYGYHYHAQVLAQKVYTSSNGLTAGQSYLSYINGPYQCWKGDVSKYPDSLNYLSSAAGSIGQCCSTNTATQAYTASGVTLKTTSG